MTHLLVGGNAHGAARFILGKMWDFHLPNGLGPLITHPLQNSPDPLAVVNRYFFLSVLVVERREQK